MAPSLIYIEGHRARPNLSAPAEHITSPVVRHVLSHIHMPDACAFAPGKQWYWGMIVSGLGLLPQHCKLHIFIGLRTDRGPQYRPFLHRAAFNLGPDVAE